MHKVAVTCASEAMSKVLTGKAPVDWQLQRNARAWTAPHLAA